MGPGIQASHSLLMFVCPEEEVGLFGFLPVKMIPKVWADVTSFLVVDLSGCLVLSGCS